MAFTNDPIADMLTRIRNAQLAKHHVVSMPNSKMRKSIARILSTLGYVGGVEELAEGPQGTLVIQLKYDRENAPVIRNLTRISKPSRRVYVGARDIEPVLNGFGVAILSTSLGVMTDSDARAANVGGEILCTVF